jgi:hypothetical protein
MNFIKNFNLVAVQTLTSTGSTAATGSAQVDMQGYDGVVFLAPFSANGGTGITLVGQGSTTAGSGDQSYANATAASTVAAGMVAVDLYKPTMRYARSLITISSTAAVCPGVIAIQYGGSKFPITQSTTSVHDSTVVAGATT